MVRIMGEKIRDLGEIHVNGRMYNVEENVGTHSTGKFDIHIQNSTFRLNINEKDFLAICTSILFAESNRRYYKNKFKQKLKEILSNGGDGNE